MRNWLRNLPKFIARTRVPLWAFRFHMVGLVGTCRYGGGELRVLYAGTKQFFQYYKDMVFADIPIEEHLGTHHILEIDRFRRGTKWDIELYRGHQALAGLGLFPSASFVPEWVSGTADLVEQRCQEGFSKSRRRDRAQLKRNDIDYIVTTQPSDLDYFYDEMYVPHVKTKHGESVVVMTREQMVSRVADNGGRLVMIRIGKEAVGGSLIFQESGRPRLYSQGVLHNNKDLLRKGVGTAIYLYSFDHLLEAGYKEVHMGWSRAQLADGTLYFKQRFGLRLDETSPIGHFFRITNRSVAVTQYLRHTGFIHRRRGPIRATLFSTEETGNADEQLEQRKAQCNALGLTQVEICRLAPNLK